MTCSTCPTPFRCFLHLRNCTQQVDRLLASGTGSQTSSSTADMRLDIGKVKAELERRKFDSRLVTKTVRMPPPYKGPRKPEPRTEAVYTREVSTDHYHDNTAVNLLTMQMLLDTQHNPGHTEWTAPSPAPEVSLAPAYQPSYSSPSPAPEPDYCRAPAPSYSYEAPSPSPSYDSGSSYSSSDSGSCGGDW